METLYQTQVYQPQSIHRRLATQYRWTKRLCMQTKLSKQLKETLDRLQSNMEAETFRLLTMRKRDSKTSRHSSWATTRLKKFMTTKCTQLKKDQQPPSKKKLGCAEFYHHVQTMELSKLNKSRHTKYRTLLHQFHCYEQMYQNFSTILNEQT